MRLLWVCKLWHMEDGGGEIEAGALGHGKGNISIACFAMLSC